MKFRRIRHRLLAALAAVLLLGFIAMAYFYNQAAENSIYNEYRRTLHRLTDSVIMSVETIMSESHAEIMPEFTKRLKTLPGVIDFRIARIDGTEAFQDNRTINAVNDRLGETAFKPRIRESHPAPVFLPGDAEIAKLFEGQESVYRIEASPAQGNLMQLFDTIPGGKKCERCHGADQKIRGVVKITSSMAALERDMMSARMQSLVILIVSLTLTMAATGYMLGRLVAEPIEAVTQAMTNISSGDFEAAVISRGKGEISEMAESFNAMRTYLRDTHLGMQLEKGKLSTLIQGTQEAVVVTDAAEKVVLVNAAACELLGKSEERICAEGIVNLVDRPDLIRGMLDAGDARPDPTLIEYRGRWLFGAASSIRDATGNFIGSAALFRDVTQEQSLLRELQRLATTDALTDVYNRRHLDATLKTELDRAKQSGLPLSVIMLDVDHFKKFNDTYGHDQGDRVLKMTGHVMKAALREYDVPCRYGGEEFAVVLPATGAAGALAVAERLRCDVESMRVDDLRVTISLGIACYPDIAAAAPEALILAADGALYRSKDGGRNRSTIATPAATEAT
ncbi:MAG: diguanylate cyclase [Sulfuritalea sp.]|nr:diguanylate cyclase [Sulfuritalea sp.]